MKMLNICLQGILLLLKYGHEQSRSWILILCLPLSDVMLYTPLTACSVMEVRSTAFAFSMLSMFALWTEVGQFFKKSGMALLDCRYAVVCLAVKMVLSFLIWKDTLEECLDKTKHRLVMTKVEVMMF